MTKIITNCDDTVLGIQEYHAALELSYDGVKATLNPREWHQSQDHSMTFDQYHRRILEWSSHMVFAVEADHAMILALAEKLQPLLDRVIDGYTIEWDGNNNVGKLTDDAQVASDEITDIMDRLHPEDWSTPVDVWDAREWLGDFHDITADTTDNEIKLKAWKFTDAAAADKIHLTYNRGETMSDILWSIRDELREQE